MSPTFYWSLDCFGGSYPPKNSEEVISEANKLIDEYRKNQDDDFEVRDYSDKLWEDFCASDVVGCVKAVW